MERNFSAFEDVEDFCEDPVLSSAVAALLGLIDSAADILAHEDLQRGAPYLGGGKRTIKLLVWATDPLRTHMMHGRRAPCALPWGRCMSSRWCGARGS